MNGTDEVRVENQNYYQGRNYALQSKTTSKKSHLLQNIIYPPKGNIYIYIYIYILEQAASSGKSRVVYLPLSTLLIQLLKKFKMQTLLQWVLFVCCLSAEFTSLLIFRYPPRLSQVDGESKSKSSWFGHSVA